jgi:hypothetical protein
MSQDMTEKAKGPITRMGELMARFNERHEKRETDLKDVLNWLERIGRNSNCDTVTVTYSSSKQRLELRASVDLAPSLGLSPSGKSKTFEGACAFTKRDITDVKYREVVDEAISDFCDHVRNDMAEVMEGYTHGKR